MFKRRRVVIDGCILIGIVAAWNCPANIGFAINTGDQKDAMDRVKYALSKEGWAGRFAESLWGSTPPPIVVYSSVKTGSIPLGNFSVPIIPCCGGVDLSQTLADAQTMREHTFSRMLKDMPATTQWFISTEDDVWWDLREVCSVLSGSMLNLGLGQAREVKEPILVGGGQASNRLGIFGPYIIMNRALLKLFANDRLLDGCRTELMTPGYNEMQEYVYPGAPYNSDHLVSHCVFKYFPKVTEKKIFIDVKQSFPMRSARIYLRPSFFFHNGPVWSESFRAPCVVRELRSYERIVAFHHATLDDMRYMERRAEGLDVTKIEKATKCGDKIFFPKDPPRPKIKVRT